MSSRTLREGSLKKHTRYLPCGWYDILPLNPNFGATGYIITFSKIYLDRLWQHLKYVQAAW